MKKATARVFCALACLVMLFSSAVSALAGGLEIGTTVSIEVENFEITSKTEDCTLEVGKTLELKAEVSHKAKAYLWEQSTDGGTTWNEIAATPTYTIQNAVQNDQADVPYKYRVTVTSAIGSTAETVISVLVSDDYKYRTIALRNGDTEASSYMHEKTRLVVTPLADEAPAARELQSKLADNHLPLVLCDVKLVNQNDEVVPYFGTVEVVFHVGDQYDGMTLHAFHFHDNTVTVYSGVVADGKLTIHVNGLSPFMVEVPAEHTHTVSAAAGTGGSVAPSGSVNVADGADKTFTFLPDAGYEVSEVKVDGAPVTFTGNSFTLSSITQNKTIDVSFSRVVPKETLYTVTINAPSHGSVYPSGKIQVRHGSAQTIYFYPDEDYELAAVEVNGAEVNVVGNSYTISAVTGDTAVTTSFRPGTAQPPNVYRTISASAGANGSISPMGDVSVEYGGDMYFYFIPNSGYVVDRVLIDGAVTPVSDDFYRFVNVVDAHTISVSFKRSFTPLPSLFYTITASSGANGSISPSGRVNVAQGGAQTFSFIPDANYELDTVTIDGVTTAVSGSAYTFTDIAANHSIFATFKQITTPTPTPTHTPTPTPTHTPTPKPTTAPEPTPVAAPTPEQTVFYAIAAGSGENGTVSPSGEVSIAEGHSAYFYFMPDEGYVVDTVTVDGKTTATQESSYCFEDVGADHSVFVTFKRAASAPEPTDYHSITVSAEGDGSISPSGAVQVADGGSQTFYLIADDGHEVEAIYVNGEKQDVVGGQFTVDGVTGDMEIRAVFKPTSAKVPPDAPHCFLCGWFGRDIAPWCWLTPLAIAVALCVALWLLLRKRQK